MNTCPDCHQTWADDGTMGEIVPGWCSACLRRVGGLHAGDNFVSVDDFSFTGTRTGRFRSDIPNLGALPMHSYRGRMQCRVRIGIPLEKKGTRWRMAYRNVAGTLSNLYLRPGVVSPMDGLDRRPFASRAAALKWARKFWPGTRVELASYGLEVTLYQPDFHLITAVNERISRRGGKLLNFASMYSDHVVARALAAFGNHYVTI